MIPLNERSRNVVCSGSMIVVWFVVMVFGSVAVYGQTRGALTLAEAVETALRINPLTKVAAAGRESAESQIREARAGHYPKIELSETFINGNNPVFVFGSLLEQGRFRQQNFDLGNLNNPDPFNNFRFGVNIKAPVFDGWQTATKVKQARLMKEQADVRTDMVEQQIRFEVLKAFYSVLVARQRKDVASGAVELAESDVKRSRDRVETGTAVVADLLSSEVQLAEFRQELIQAEGGLIMAMAGLNTAMGMPVNSSLNIAGALTAKSFDPGDLEELMRAALENRPDYATAGIAQRITDEGLKGARGEYLPRFDLFTNFGASRHNWANGSGDYLVGASITFNLFDAGRSARLARARSEADRAAGEQEHLANRIRFEVVQTYQQFITARERLNVAERIVVHAEEALRIVQDRYNEGLTTITELLRAENAMLRSQMNMLSSRYDYYVGFANILLSTGRLDDVGAFL